MKTVKQLHAEWAAVVTPPGASQVQRQEMERAFFAGYISALRWAVGDMADLPTAAGLVALERQFEECETYFKTLRQAGRDVSHS